MRLGLAREIVDEDLAVADRKVLGNGAQLGVRVRNVPPHVVVREGGDLLGCEERLHERNGAEADGQEHRVRQHNPVVDVNDNVDAVYIGKGEVLWSAAAARHT